VNSSPSWHDLLLPRPFVPVVAGAHVRSLREKPASDETRDFVGGFLGFDPRSRHALKTTIESLSSTRNGGAFWVNGAFGSGKSHFLGVLALACDGAGREELRANFPELALPLDAFAPRLVVYIPLDDYDPDKWGLENVFWREAKREWEHAVGEWPASIETAREGSRAEALEALLGELLAQGRSGLALFLDETSLFLGGRAIRELQGDASFLQFLGQSARRERVWIVAALQKSIEDLGGLEPYALGQIRDRFQTLPLSLAHLPALIARRLLYINDEAALEDLCAVSFRERETRFGTLPFGAREWRDVAPFHPATVELLEAVTGRFLSRTRSAMLFCGAWLEQGGDANRRVTPDAVWDYFAPEIENHPDWSVLSEAQSAWLEWSATAPETERAALEQTAKFLLLCRVAGRSVSPLGLCQSLDFEHENPAEWGRYLLEKLRRGGGFLAHERGEEPLSDRYALDLGKRVGESARRAVLGAASEIENGDARLCVAALGACKAGWPLGELGDEGRTMALFWRHSPRNIRVGVWHPDALTAWINRLGALRDANESALLLFWPPFSLPSGEGTGEELAPLARGAVAAWGEPRALAAMWAWRPRQPTRDEWELAREVAGAHLVAQDPNLLDNRRGRAMLEHLERERAAREGALERVVRRMYLEGELVLGSGAVLEASELSGGDDFVAVLESVADFALPHLYPRFGDVAPRARVLTNSNTDALCLELLRRPATEPFFAPSLERLARHLGEPLGVAKMSAGRWKMAAGESDLVAYVLDLVGGGAALSHLSLEMARGDWGLTEGLLDVVLCALFRAGELAALDARGQTLSPPSIGLPLRRSVHRVVRGALPTSSQWTVLGQVAHTLLGFSLGAPSFDEAARLAGAVESWREDLTARLELARARAAQLRRSLGHSPAQWAEFERATGVVAGALNDVRSGDQSELFARVCQFDLALLANELRVCNRFCDALASAGELLAGHALLSHPDLVSPPDLSAARTALTERLVRGEEALFDAELRGQLRQWRADYAERYAQWHGAQHDPARWNSLARLSRSDDLRALERLGTLARRRFEEGDAIRRELDEAGAKMCPRPDAAHVTLGSEPVCNACALKWGERVGLPDPAALEAQLLAAVAGFQNAVNEPAVHRFLERRSPELLERDENLPLLSGQELAVLDEAFAPRRNVSRSLEELRAALTTLETRREWEAALLQWLDGDDHLGDDDEVKLRA